MSDWVNWQQFNDLNKTEVQREADEQQQANAQQQAVMQKALSGLGDAAGAQAAAGTYQGLDKLAGYGDLMKMRDQQLRDSQQTQSQAAPWEQALHGGQQQAESPWAQLTKKLGDYDAKYATANTATQNRQAYQAQLESQREFNRQQAAKLAASKPKDNYANEYARWSDAVQNSGSHYAGSPGAGAYYDAWQGQSGAAQPPSYYDSNNNPWSQDARNKARTGYGASDPSSSNFGKNTTNGSF